MQWINVPSFESESNETYSFGLDAVNKINVLSLGLDKDFFAGLQAGNKILFFGLQLVKMVNDSVAAGAKTVRGGLTAGGLFYTPTLLTGVTMDMPVATNEIFGPVAAIIKFQNEEEVIRLANTTERGLAGECKI